MKNSLILIGGGGHCKSCIDVVEQEGCYTIAGILDKAEMVGTHVLDYPVIGTDEEIARLAQNHCFLIQRGSNFKDSFLSNKKRPTTVIFN